MQKKTLRGEKSAGIMSRLAGFSCRTRRNSTQIHAAGGSFPSAPRDGRIVSHVLIVLALGLVDSARTVAEGQIKRTTFIFRRRERIYTLSIVISVA